MCVRTVLVRTYVRTHVLRTYTHVLHPNRHHARNKRTAIHSHSLGEIKTWDVRLAAQRINDHPSDPALLLNTLCKNKPSTRCCPTSERSGKTRLEGVFSPPHPHLECAPSTSTSAILRTHGSVTYLEPTRTDCTCEHKQYAHSLCGDNESHVIVVVSIGIVVADVMVGVVVEVVVVVVLVAVAHIRQ